MDLRIPDCLPKDSWFREWMELWPTSESPKSFLLFSGMAMLGTCLGRRVWLDQDIHQVRPMLNLLLIGPSGIGKSTAVKIAKKLLPHVPDKDRPQFIEGGTTKEKLHLDLVERPNAILFAPELAAFFSKEKYKESLIPYVTNLLDYEDTIELRTRRDGTLIVNNPSVSIVGASTLEWLQDQLPDSAVSGGFLARFLIVNEETKGQKIANPHRLLSARAKELLDKKRIRVMEEFGTLATFHEGGIDYEDYEAAEAFAKWYNAYQPASGYLAPFAARAGELILRLAMLLAISAQRHGISVADIKSATTLYEFIASKLDRIVVATNLQGKLTAMILDCVGEEGLEPGIVARKLRSLASYQEIERHIESLTLSGAAVLDGNILKKA